MLLLTFAFIAGLATILSPCILPLVPLVLATGAGGGKGRPLGVIAGLAISFTLATLIVSTALAALGLPGDLLRWIAIAALVGFGLMLLIPALGARLEPFFTRRAPAGARATGTGFGSGLLLGLTLGVVWAPCVGPIMASVIVLSATQGLSPQAAAITLAYVIGAGIPLLGIAIGGRALALRLRRALGPAGGRVQQALGALALMTSLLIALGLDLRLQTLAGSTLPVDWSARLTAIEIQPSVQQELQALNPSNNLGSAPAIVAAPPAAPVEQAAPPTVVPAQAAIVPPAAPTDPPAPPPTATLAPPPPATAVPPTAVAAAPRLSLPDMGLAAALRGTGRWFNSPPTSLAALRGKVVVLNFWTFACYNCNNTLPYVKAWYDKYAAQGLVILGVHTPEFSYEKVADNVANAIAEKGIKYPVVQDNDYQTWNAYNNIYWPAFYFIDAQGHIRHTHWGEGAYDESEQVIQQLLVEAHNQ